MYRGLNRTTTWVTPGRQHSNTFYFIICFRFHPDFYDEEATKPARRILFLFLSIFFQHAHQLRRHYS